MAMSIEKFDSPEAALRFVVEIMGPVEVGRVCAVSHQAVRQWTRVPTRAKARAISRRLKGRVSENELYPEE